MRYQRLMPLGSGGMANVHLSLAIGQSGFKRLVVVKSVREELLEDPTTRQMFLEEARLSARLNHPNVVQVSEVLETEEGAMLVMEYLDGLAFSAACRVAGDKLSLSMRLRVLCDTLSGLAYAHDLVDYHGEPLGIVHRDVSAQNVFLTFDGRVKLLDFGIAKVTSAPDRTRNGVIKGRIAYMPVEQVTGKAVDRRTDVYAIGCLLWEAVAGSRLWGTMTEPQIVRNVLKGAVPPLSSRVEADPELERIVARATAHLPVDRYQTADELRLDLERFMRTLPVVTSRDIGELLSNICREARAEQKRELAVAISRAERELASQGIDVDGSSQMRISIEGPDSSQTPGSSSRRQRIMRSMSPTPGPFLAPSPEVTQASRSASFTGTIRPRRTWMWVGIGLAALLAAVAWAPSLLRAPISAAAADHPTAALAPAVTAPPAAATVSETVLKTEQEPTSAPSASTSAKTHRVRAHGVAPPVGSPAAASAKPSARPGCDPPYFFSAGIKTYKPECI
jgi:eukaryotic-like serine/threonine-protein kinase